MSAEKINETQVIQALTGHTFPATAAELAEGFKNIYHTLPEPRRYSYEMPQNAPGDPRWDMACKLYYDALSIHFGKDPRYQR